MFEINSALCCFLEKVNLLFFQLTEKLSTLLWFYWWIKPHKTCPHYKENILTFNITKYNKLDQPATCISATTNVSLYSGNPSATGINTRSALACWSSKTTIPEVFENSSKPGSGSRVTPSWISQYTCTWLKWPAERVILWKGYEMMWLTYYLVRFVLLCAQYSVSLWVILLNVFKLKGDNLISW